MADRKSNTVAFSGHRTFKIEGDNLLFAGHGLQTPEEISAKLRNIITNLYDMGYTDYLCGMAEGFDILAAESVLQLRRELPGLRLIAVVPFPGQASRFCYEVRERYDSIISQAADIITVCRSFSPDCYHKRNDYLVDNSSMLVCYYNGSKGGTAYTVKRALKNGLNIINILD